MTSARILIVEDESIIAYDLKENLLHLGYQVTGMAGSGEEALSLVEKEPPDLVLMDIKLKGQMNGIEAADKTHTLYHIPVVYLTANADKATVERAKKTEAYGFIYKPIQPDLLQAVIELALYKHQAEKKVIEHEAWLGATLQSIGDAVIATNAQGVVEYMNPVAEALTGWQQKEAEGHALYDVFTVLNSKTGEPIKNPVDLVLKNGETTGLGNHTILKSKSGKEYQISDSASPIKNARGNITGVVLVFRDVTESYQIQEALRASETLLADVFESIQDGISVLDKELNIVRVNHVMKQWYADSGPLENKKCYWCYQGKEKPCEPCPSLRCIETGKTQREIVPGPSDSPVEWIELFSYPAKNRETGEITGAIEFVRNISEQTKARNALIENEENLRITLNSIGDAVISTDLNGKITRMNPAAENLTGWSFEEARGEPIAKVFRIVNSKTRKKVRNPVNTVLKTGKIVGLANHTLLISKLGEEYQIADSGAPILDANGKITGVVLVFRDVTREYELREKVMLSEARYRSLFEQSRDGVAIHDLNGKLINVNPALCELFGYSEEEFLRLNITQTLFDDEESQQQGREALQEINKKGLRTWIEIDTEGYVHFTGKCVTKTGDSLLADVTSTVVDANGEQLVTVIFRDITEKIQTEKQLRENQEKLKKNLIEMRALNNLGNQNNLRLSLDEIIQNSINSLYDLFVPDAALLFLRDGNNLVLKEGIYKDEKYRHDETPVHKVSECLCGLAVSLKQPQYSEDIHADPKCTWHECKKAGFQSFAAIPLVSAGEVIAVIGLGSVTRRDFSQQSTFLELIANEISGGLKNAILYNDLKEQSLALENEIEERETIEQSLREREEQLQILFNQATDAIFVYDSNGQLKQVNDKACASTRYSELELLNLNVIDLDTGFPTHQMLQAFIKTLETGQTITIETEYRRKDGSIFPVEMTVARLETPDGIRIMSIARDILQRKKALKTIKENEAKLMSIFSAAPIGIGVVKNRIFADVNEQVCNLVGYSKKELLGKSARMLYPSKADYEYVGKEKYRQIAEKGTGTVETRFKRKNGEIRDVLLSSTPFDVHDLSLGVTFTVLDITERKKSESERESLISELERKNTELEQFTYTISHDLKSPMITVSGFLDVLLTDIRANNLEKVETDYTLIKDAVMKMDELLKDILELSRIGRIVNPPEKISFNTLVDNALSLTRGILDSQQAEVTVQSDMPEVYVDPVRVQEVLINLIENAVKFSKEEENPQIEIGYKKTREKPVFFVKDNGVGIREKYHTKIFKLFDKLDPESKGTGLGLALVKRIIEVHHGSIWVESKGTGKGTTFYFTLPDKPFLVD